MCDLIQEKNLNKSIEVEISKFDGLSVLNGAYKSNEDDAVEYFNMVGNQIKLLMLITKLNISQGVSGIV